MRGQSIALIWAVATVAGCGRPSGNDGGPALDVLILKPLGFVSQTAYPGDDIALKVVALRSAGAEIASEADLVAADGEVIDWRLVGSADAALSNNAALTDDSGIASISVNVGALEGSSFQVTATLQDATPVTFSIEILADTRVIELITASPKATAVNRTERLRVRLLRANGAAVPAADIDVTFEGWTVANTAALEPVSGTPVGTTTITTDPAGIASIRMKTGATANASYQITFSHSKGPVSSFIMVNVTAVVTNPGGACELFTDCDTGFVCDQGTCELAAVYCNVDDDCPPGWDCGSTTRKCELRPAGGGCTMNSNCLADEVCDGGGTCIPDDGCDEDGDCPTGWTCDLASGACQPPTCTDAIDVRGDWLTRYHFDISDALPGIFTNALKPVVTFLDLLFRSQLDIGGGFLGDIIEAFIDDIIDQYVPPWVRTVVTVLGDFIYAFENFEVEGEMQLLQFVETGACTYLSADVTGDEDWVSATSFIPSLCAGGIQEFNADPSCGAVDLVLDATFPLTYSNNDPTVGVRVDPFIGQVQLDQLVLFNRHAEIALTQLINVLLDVIVAIASNGNWYDFETFLQDIIPCLELQFAIDDLACDITDGSLCSVPGIEAACNAAATLAIAELTNALGSIDFQVMELDFNQSALIRADTSTPPVAWQLGNPSNPAAESTITGDVEALILFDGALDADSWWYGVR